MNRESVNSAIVRFFEVSPFILGVSMAVLLMGRGVYGIWDLYDEGWRDWWLYLAHSITIVGGIISLVLSRYSIVRLIGVYAISVGISRIMIATAEAYYEGSLIMFMLTGALIIFSLNLIVKGISFAAGNVIGRKTMMLSSMVLAAGYLTLVLIQFDFGNIFGIVDAEDNQYQYLMNFFSYIILVVMLDLDSLRYGTRVGKHISNLDHIRGTFAFDSQAFIDTDAARCLLDRSGGLWKTIDDPVVESEMVFEIGGRVMHSTVTAQIWKGESPIYLTITYEDGSVLLANRAAVDYVFESDGKLHLMGRDGTRIVLAMGAGGST